MLARVRQTTIGAFIKYVGIVSPRAYLRLLVFTFIGVHTIGECGVCVCILLDSVIV